MGNFMTSPRKKVVPLLLLIGCIFLLDKNYGQESSGFSYLITCFKGGNVDSFETDIKGIGTLMTYNLTSDNVNSDVMLSYYDIPANIQSKSEHKLADLAAHRQIDIWKNNSKLLLYKESRSESAIIIAVRLHILIEDIFLHIIVVLENNRVFELDGFQDNYNAAAFDRVTKRIIKKNCP